MHDVQFIDVALGLDHCWFRLWCGMKEDDADLNSTVFPSDPWMLDSSFLWSAHRLWTIEGTCAASAPRPDCQHILSLQSGTQRRPWKPLLPTSSPRPRTLHRSWWSNTSSQHYSGTPCLTCDRFCSALNDHRDFHSPILYLLTARVILGVKSPPKKRVSGCLQHHKSDLG